MRVRVEGPVDYNKWADPIIGTDAHAGLASQSKQLLQGTSVAACKWKERHSRAYIFLLHRRKEKKSHDSLQRTHLLLSEVFSFFTPCSWDGLIHLL